MKKLLIILFAPVVLLADYYDKSTSSFTNELPRPLVFNGKSVLNPKWSDYYAAGWRLASSSKGDIYSIPVFQAIQTNISASGKEMIFRQIVYMPISINKPEFIQAAEGQYLYSWASIFGPTDTGYTNASYDEVAFTIMQMSQTNQSVLEYTHAMERSFTFLQTWWTSVTQRASFHPYPWGMTTNIVIKDVVGDR